MRRTILALLFMMLSVPAFSKDILISFDGSGYCDMWKDSIQFAKDNHCKFTYFVSAPYYLTWAQEKNHPYWALTEDKRPLLIKFREDTGEQANNIKYRFKYTEEAQYIGCEIGSHLVGHYDGRPWTYGQWMKEFAYFKWVMSSDPGDFTPYDQEQITCVRVPFMCTNPAYYQALKDSGFKYDASASIRTLHGEGWHQVPSDTANVPEVPLYYEQPYDANNIPMNKKWLAPFDCDWVAAIQWPLFPNTYSWGQEKDDMTDTDKKNMKVIEDSFFNSICYSYLHDDHVCEISLHFQHRPGEPYYNAMKRFVYWVKDKNPNFLTYSEYAEKEKNK